MKWLTRHFETIVPLLLVTAAALLLATSIRYGLLTTSLLASNKESLAALSDAITILAVTIGGVFSYYRFFRGRTFFRRAELSISVAVIPTTESYNLHAVTLHMKNIGSLSIWEPVPILRVHEFGPEGVKEEIWDEWQEAQSPIPNRSTLAVVDSGETVAFVNHSEVDKSIWAVGYVAFVSSNGEEVWKCVATVRNTPNDTDGKT